MPEYHLDRCQLAVQDGFDFSAIWRCRYSNVTAFVCRLVVPCKCHIDGGVRQWLTG